MNFIEKFFFKKYIFKFFIKKLCYDDLSIEKKNDIIYFQYNIKKIIKMSFSNIIIYDVPNIKNAKNQNKIIDIIMLYNDLLDHKLIINNALLYKINEFDRIAVYNIYKNKKFNINRHIKKIFY